MQIVILVQKIVIKLAGSLKLTNLFTDRFYLPSQIQWDTSQGDDFKMGIAGETWGPRNAKTLETSTFCSIMIHQLSLAVAFISLW